MERKAMADGRESPTREDIPADLQEHMTYFGRGPCLVSQGQTYVETEAGPCGWVWPKSDELRKVIDSVEKSARAFDTTGFTGSPLTAWSDLPPDATEPEDRREYEASPERKPRDPRVLAMNEAFSMPSPDGAAFFVSICKLVGRPETNAKLEWDLGPDEFIADGITQALAFVAQACAKAIKAGTDGNVGTVALGRLLDTIEKLAKDLHDPSIVEVIRTDMEEFFANGAEEETVQ